MSPDMLLHSGSCAVCKAEGELIEISQFGKALCPSCFPAFIQRHVRSLMRRRQMHRKGDTVAVALSGGKDSAVLAHVLKEISWNMRIELVGLHIDMGLGAYSELSERVVRDLCEKLRIKLEITRVSDFGVSIQPVGQFRQCNVCGAVRRALMNRTTRNLGLQVLATGHTLDDILQFMLKAVLSGHLDAPRPVLPPSEHRPRKIKPLYFTPEAATAAYAELLELPYTNEQCPLFDPAGRRFNEIFDLLEQKAPMGTIQYAHTMLRAMKRVGKDELKRVCPMCGEPTNTELCPICRLRRQQLGED